jgi:hypothetical protein
MNKKRENAMPRQIRYFWWFSIALVLFWSVAIVLNTIGGLAAADKLPETFRAAARMTQIVHAVFGIAIWCGVILLASWLAAFRRKNWGRYVFVFFVLANLASPFVVALCYYGLNIPFSWLAPRIWLDPENYVTVFLLIAASTFAFSRPAQRWFRDG